MGSEKDRAKLKLNADLDTSRLEFISQTQSSPGKEITENKLKEARQSVVVVNEDMMKTTPRNSI